MFFYIIRLKNLLFNRLSNGCIYTDIIYSRYIFNNLPKHLLEEFLFNSNVLTLDAFDRLLPSIDTQNYWRLHLYHIKLSNQYWLEEIHRFLFDSDYTSISNAKEFYFKIHFYSRIFPQRDLLVHITNNQYINILCLPLKHLTKISKIKSIAKNEAKDEYYLNNKQIRLIIFELEQTLWLSYIKELSFDYFESHQWLKLLPHVNYFQPNKFQLFLDQTSNSQIIKQILQNKNLQSLSLINKSSLLTLYNLIDCINPSITHLSIELMNTEDMDYHICYLIETFSQTLTSLELKRISLSSKLFEILSKLIPQLIEFSFETSFSFSKTIELLKNLFSENPLNLKQLKLTYISRRYWLNSWRNFDEKFFQMNLSKLYLLNLTNFYLDLNDMKILKEFLSLSTLTHMKFINIHCDEKDLDECFKCQTNLKNFSYC